MALPSSSAPPPITAAPPAAMAPKATQQPSKPPATVDLYEMQYASRVLEDQFAKDAQAVPEFGDMLFSSRTFPSLLYAPRQQL